MSDGRKETAIVHPTLDDELVLIGQRFVATVDFDEGTMEIPFALVSIIRDSWFGKPDWALIGDDGEEYYLLRDAVRRAENGR